MTESEFYYQSMLQANEWRRDPDNVPSAAMLMAFSGQAFNAAVATNGEIVKCEAYREYLVKVAAIAMRLATSS